MRTRFLNIDYFNPSSSTQTLSFLHFPLPHLPPSSLSDFEEVIRCCFDSALTAVSVDVDLPIHGALSKFYSDVLPQIIDVQIGDSSQYVLEDRNDCVNEQRFGAGSDETRLLEKANETTVDGKDGRQFEAVQFEEPHLDLFLIEDSFSEQEGMHLLSEVPEAKINLDMLLSELQMQYSYEIQESVYSLENVSSEYHIDQEAYLLEDAGSVQDQNPFFNCTFPLLEVGEISVGVSLGLSVEDEFHLHLESVELQCTQNDLMIDGKELVDSVDINLLENFPDPCLKQCLESEMACLNMFLEEDYISVMDSSNGQRNSAFHADTSDGLSYVSVSPIRFQEIQILDLDLSQCSEIFSDHPTIAKPEICFPILMEDMNLKSFNELVVSHELTLADDTFKSLPVPIFSDPESIKSLYDIVEEILEDMKLQPLSATDGIYLDWHLLEEDKCNYQNMLDDMINFSIDFDLKSIDDKKFILDFVFSGDINKPDMGESKELLNMIPSDLSMLDAHFAGVGSIKNLESRCPKPGNGEILVDSNAERISLLFESMSQFNDLDFFLNPRKANAGRSSENVAKTFNTKPTFPMVQSGESSTEKVELEDCNVPNALCKGGDIPQNTGFPMEGQSHLFPPLDENANEQVLKKLPNTIPMKHKNNLRYSEAEDSLEVCSLPLPVPCAQWTMNSKQIQSSMPSFPDKVIIVNTQNFEKETIISRRNTYQKILAMEKEGAQVVERDSDLPVDVIINAAVCLVWYDSRNIGKKSTPRDEASSCLPLCVENIATNVLTMLSFAFSGCILVFEGDMSFIAQIMESSDGLYAAAASLGIDLQLFFSYSSELTDEIILNSIELATKSTRGLYPAMPESETIAESFLTKFPSLNPLSAHAVLSTGGTLIEFLEWSHERRIQSIRKYHVPEESVTLLSALCRYGERAESKSGMTDCSSSVSSAPDSEYFLHKTNSVRKKQKNISDPKLIDVPIDAFLQSEPLNPPSVSKQYDSGMSIGLDILSETKKADLSLSEMVFGQKHGSGRAMTDNLNRHEISKSDILHEEFVGEVIDFNDSSLFDADFPSVLNSVMRSTLVNAEKKHPAATNLKTARRLSFGNNTIPTFPAATEINHGSDLWGSANDYKQNLNQDVIGYFDTDFNIDNMPLMHPKEVSGKSSKQNSAESFNELPFHEKEMSHYRSDIWNSMQDHKQNLTQDVTGYSDTAFNIDHTPLRHRRELSEEGSKQNSAKGYNELSFYEKDASHYGETPLRSALCSSQLQQGSPWTMEFLNRIRERSRLRQQSLPCNLSLPGFGNSRNISKNKKRKSPSILDFYKYKGGSAPKKIEQKKQKRSMQPSSSSKNEKPSVPFCPTWTPLDKQARQTLSFATNGNGCQAKLVWSDGNVRSLNRRF